MLADKAPRVAPRAARLAAEARGVRAVLDGQLVAVQNVAPVQVRHGHLRGRDKEVIRARHLEGVLLKLGQLARAGHRGAVHHVGREYLGVPVGGMGVEKIADDRPLQPCAQPAVDREPRAGDLAGGGEIQNAQILADIPVRLGLKAEIPRLAPAAYLNVLGVVRALGYGLVRDVGDCHQQVVQPVVAGVHLGVKLLYAVGKRLHLGKLLGAVDALLLELGYFGGDRVALRLHVLDLLKHRAALLIESKQLGHVRALVAPLAHSLNELFRVLPYTFDVQHIVNSSVDRCLLDILFKSAALLVLLAAAAGAGVVRPHLARYPLGLGLVIHSRRVDGLCHLLALDGLRVLPQHYVVEVRRRLVADTRYHLVEHVEALVAVLYDGVLGAHRAKADALTQLIHSVDVIHPMLVDRAQQVYALQLAHVYAVLLKVLLALGIAGVRRLMQSGLQLRRIAAREGGGGHVEIQKLLYGMHQTAHIPAVGLGVAGAVHIHAAVDGLHYHLMHGIVYVLAHQHLSALTVDDLTHLVHGVVVLQYVFADIEVVRLDPLLRSFDIAAEHLEVEADVLVARKLVHHAAVPVRAEPAHKVVLHGNEEAGRAGVALSARAAAQLVIDSPRLVTLRADNVQTARSDYLLMLLVGADLELLVKLVIGLPRG